MAPKLRQPGIFGQMCWDTYTLIILGFADQPGSTRDEVLATLDKAALRVLSAYPFLAGQVVKHGQTATNSGTYEIVPYPPHDNKSPVRRKDCTELCASYEEIVRADAPFSMLDGDVICPMKGMGYAYDPSTELPVFIVQANFVKGGLLLCFASMHNALDMNGQGTVLKMFAAAGRGEELDPTMVAVGNQDADTIVPLLKPGEAPLSHENMRRPSTLGVSPAPSGRPRPAPWNYWRFSSDSLSALKKAAVSGSNWVSTNDAITAFFVRRLTAVRVAAGRVAPADDVALQRAVDGRSILKPPVPDGYLGHLVALSETKWPTAQGLCESPVSEAAMQLRASLREVDDHFVRSLATLIKTTEDKTTIFYGAKTRAGRDFLISSWAQLHWLVQCDFGPGLGTVDFVRRARLPEVPDLSYIMPKDKKGNMHLAASMFQEDFVGLVNDQEWRQYAELVG
jgi:trichothecene 3-O-acetyltransferase